MQEKAISDIDYPHRKPIKTSTTESNSYNISMINTNSVLPKTKTIKIHVENTPQSSHSQIQAIDSAPKLKRIRNVVNISLRPNKTVPAESTNTISNTQSTSDAVDLFKSKIKKHHKRKITYSEPSSANVTVRSVPRRK
jgi:hypothetical protein